MITYTHTFNFLRPYLETGAPLYSGLDIETEVIDLGNGTRTGIFPRNTNIATVQIELSDSCWVVHWSPDVDLKDVVGVDLFRQYLESPHITKVIHNAPFEHGHLMWAFRADSETWPLHIAPIHDTQVGEYVLAQGRGFEVDPVTKTWRYFVHPDDHPRQQLSLGDTICRRYWVEMDKDPAVRLSFRRGGQLTPRQIEYAAWDAIWAARLARDQLREMDDDTRRAFELDCANARVVAQMFLRGVPLDVGAAMALHSTWSAAAAELERAIQSVLWVPGDGEPVRTPKTGRIQIKRGQPVIQTLNVSSDKQMPERLNQYGVPVPSYEALELKRLQLEQGVNADPLLTALVKWKQLNTYTTRYTNSLPKFYNPDTGCVHFDYKTTRTMTGRASVADPPLQQIPTRDPTGAKIRECFRAPKGYVFVLGDYSMIELRFIAELWNEPTMLRALASNRDIHTLTGASFGLGVPTTDWAVLDPAYERLQGAIDAGDPGAIARRRNAKPANFGLGYGAGPPKLQFIALKDHGLIWTLKEAQGYHRAWHALYRGVGRHHRELSQRIRTDGVVCMRTLEGRKRWCRGFSEAVNFEIQGSCGELLKRAQTATQDMFDHRLAIHDELIVLAAEDEAEEVKTALAAEMVRAGEHYLKRVPVTVDVHIAEVMRK